MIATELHNGQGLGNQLWCYVTTRVIAIDRGLDFGIKSPDQFKASDFMSVEFGSHVPDTLIRNYEELKLTHITSGSDVRVHDKDLINVADDTIISGYMQDEQYIIHRRDEIRSWLKVRPEFEFRDFSKDNICIINFRGSGYVNEKEFFLPPRYWENAIQNMCRINPLFRFIVITEDVTTAKKFFPDFDVFHFSIARDYVIIKNAKYLILSNSSFAWFPAWLSTDLEYCIAPKYWARHNISDGYWSLGYNITSGWMYQDRKGNLSNYDTCLRELKTYMNTNTNKFSDKAIIYRSFGLKLRNQINIFLTLGRDTSYTKTLLRMLFISITQGIRSRVVKGSNYKEKTPTDNNQNDITTSVSTKQAFSIKSLLESWLKNKMATHGYY